MTMVIPVATIYCMDIPTWLGGIYQKGREDGRWTSIEDMARAYGFKTASLDRWMTGQRRPEPLSCFKLSRAFDVPVDDVLVMAGHGEDVRTALLT